MPGSFAAMASLNVEYSLLSSSTSTKRVLPDFVLNAFTSATRTSASGMVGSYPFPARIAPWRSSSTTIPGGSTSRPSTTISPTSRTGREAGRMRWSSASSAKPSALPASTTTAPRSASRARSRTAYVLPEYRGQGLGVRLVREMVDNGPYADIRWVLHTRDGHGLYRKVGFGEPSERVMERG